MVETILYAIGGPHKRHLDFARSTGRIFDETFDTITAFRFFLNAEERLRHLGCVDST
jgi:hypothetical protein